jgi:hypothetical protein
MKTSIRRKLEMAARVRDFVRAHPDPNPGTTAAAERLVERLARAEGLAQQAVAGRQAVSGAIAARRKLRNEIADTLALLAGLGREAAREEPDLSPAVAPQRGSTSNQAFLTGGRVAAAAATTHRELLQRYGMPETFPDDLGRMLDQFEASLNERNAGQAAHVGAHADLDAVSAELMHLVRQLDALNEFRFRNDAEALGAWRSARNVPWPNGEKQERATEGDGVRPAA